jgi:3-(3-hydroxy-phenyl)propionate hydroxylase
MLKPGEREEDFLDEQSIAAMIKQAKATLPTSLQTAESTKDTENWEIGSVQIKRKIVYRFYATIATAFSRGRVFLLGDAAHLMPPFGGQGMNSGLRDAYNLCWKLKLVIEGQASDHLLTSYQQERYPHVAQMILFSSLLGKLILSTNPLLAWMRDIFFHSIGKIPLILLQFTEMRIKPQPIYTAGCLLPTKQTKLVGHLLPQPYVLQNGERIRLDDILGDDFTILRLYEKPAKAFTELQNEKWLGLNIRFVCVQPQSVTSTQRQYEDKEVVRDCDGVLENFFGHRRDIFVLVRPDHYVMGTFHVEHAGKVLWAIHNVLDAG